MEEGRYFIVENLTAGPQVIVPASRKRAGEDLVLPPYAKIEIDEPEPWQNDRNLAKAVDRGLVRFYWSSDHPQELPVLAAQHRPSDPRLYNMIRAIVFGADDMARDFITAEPHQINRAGQPVDREWLKTTGWSVLEAAQSWLTAWGPPETHRWRLELIKERLAFIQRLP